MGVAGQEESEVNERFAEDQPDFVRKNSVTITASGGYCAPTTCSLEIWVRESWVWKFSKYQARERDDETRWQRIRRWFTWDKDWGLPLQGFVAPGLRYLFPAVQVQRGPIDYFKYARGG